MTYTISTTFTSPNHSPRHGAAIRMIVLHATVGDLMPSIRWLISPASRVSSHYVISKSGRIYQLVPDELVAWHAGASAWMGLNKDQIAFCSLGVELENANDGHDPYPSAQLAAAHWLCEQKVTRYGIIRPMVVRHLDIATPKGRKTDPAGLPWPSFADSLYMQIDPPAQARYRVRHDVTAGAKIRAAPRQNAAVLGFLKAGDAWSGETVTGQQVFVAGFGSSNQWVRDARMRFVWRNLLEEVA